MLNNYILFYQSSGIFGDNDCATKSYQNTSTNFSSILGSNRWIINRS